MQRRAKPIEVKVHNILLPILECYRAVTLGMDIMMINKIRFLVRISHNIRFGTRAVITNLKIETLVQSFKQIQLVYMQWGFRIKEVCMDSQFELMRGDLAGMGVHLNTVSMDEHVPKIE